jgi:preprotein translocase subunit SecB
MNESNSMLKTAERFAKNISLLNIFLQEANCTRSVGQPPKKSDISIELNSKLIQSDKEDVFRYAIKFTIKAVDNENSLPVFQIDAEFCVIYKAKEGTKPDQDELKAFGMTGAVYNAWPYAREFVQNTLVRMNLPPFVMPPLRMSELAKLEKNETSTANAGQ